MSYFVNEKILINYDSLFVESWKSIKFTFIFWVIFLSDIDWGLKVVIFKSNFVKHWKGLRISLRRGFCLTRGFDFDYGTFDERSSVTLSLQETMNHLIAKLIKPKSWRWIKKVIYWNENLKGAGMKFLHQKYKNPNMGSVKRLFIGVRVIPWENIEKILWK